MGLPPTNGAHNKEEDDYDYSYPTSIVSLYFSCNAKIRVTFSIVYFVNGIACQSNQSEESSE